MRQLTEQEKEAKFDAWDKYLSQKGRDVTIGAKQGFEAGFIAGLDYRQADTQGRTWHVTERDDGSVVVYYTKPDDPAQYVVFDTLDTEG